MTKAFLQAPTIQHQQFILEGLLQVLKHNNLEDVQDLLQQVRCPSAPRGSCEMPKREPPVSSSKGVLPVADIYEVDLLSLGLKSLFTQRPSRSQWSQQDVLLRTLRTGLCR